MHVRMGILRIERFDSEICLFAEQLSVSPNVPTPEISKQKTTDDVHMEDIAKPTADDELGDEGDVRWRRVEVLAKENWFCTRI